MTRTMAIMRRLKNPSPLPSANQGNEDGVAGWHGIRRLIHDPLMYNAFGCERVRLRADTHEYIYDKVLHTLIRNI